MYLIKMQSDVSLLRYTSLNTLIPTTHKQQKQRMTEVCAYLIKMQSDVSLLRQTSLQYSQDFQTQCFIAGTVVLVVDVYRNLHMETNRTQSCRPIRQQLSEKSFAKERQKNIFVSQSVSFSKLQPS